MAANENTKFQVNFKTHKDGTLINIYADSIRELETQITDISMIASLIKTTEAELASTNATATAVQNIQAQFNATPVAVTSTGQDAASATKMCKHGVMAFKTGTSAKGPWQGYMCAAPRGASDKCETIWVR